MSATFLHATFSAFKVILKVHFTLKALSYRNHSNNLELFVTIDNDFNYCHKELRSSIAI